MFNNYLLFFLFGFIIVCVVCFSFYRGLGLKLHGVSSGRGVWIRSFECGFVGHGYREKVFSYTFLNLMVIFIIFDLEVSLLLKIPFYSEWFDSYFLYVLFILIVGVGYLVELEKGYARWVF